MRIENRERESAEANDELTKQLVELRSTDSRISMLEEMEKEYEGFGGAVKSVMREARRGALRGVHGTVAELLRTDGRFALAIETALGAAIQNIVVDTQNDGQTGHRAAQAARRGPRHLPAPGRDTRRAGWTIYRTRTRAASASRRTS